jgi:hypothetical protein
MIVEVRQVVVGDDPGEVGLGADRDLLVDVGVVAGAGGGGGAGGELDLHPAGQVEAGAGRGLGG